MSWAVRIEPSWNGAGTTDATIDVGSTHSGAARCGIAAAEAGSHSMTALKAAPCEYWFPLLPSRI